MRRVAVTGLGAVTPLGVGVDLNWRRLLAGESGISAIESFDVSDLPCKIGGMVSPGQTKDGEFNVDDWVPRKDQRKMDRFIIFAVAAARQAIEDSKVIRRGALQHKANYTTTLNAAFATVKSNAASAFESVASVQELHKRVNG